MKISLIRLTSVIVLLCMTFTIMGCKKNNGKNTNDIIPIVISKDKIMDQNENDDLLIPSESADPVSYTYNNGGSAIFSVFNPHEWESSEDAYILDYTTIGLYDFAYNEKRNGYVQVPEMAAEFPIDVTSQYAGNEIYGVPDDVKEGYAFKISLREDAYWENGIPINADTYVYSMKQLLNPDIKNIRAGYYYSEKFSIANAKAYNKSNDINYTDVFKESGYADVEEKDMYFSFTKNVAFFDSYSAKDYYEKGYSDNFIINDENIFEKYASEDYLPLTKEAKEDLIKIAKSFNITDNEIYKKFCFYIDEPLLDFNKVGIIKTGEYEITLILDEPITKFNLLYILTKNWIVYEDLYEAGKIKTDEIINTNYGTSFESYISYGPYKITSYQKGKQIILSKNDKWYGYNDGKHEGMWKTTRIVYDVINNQTECMQLFLEGKLDTVMLSANDMLTYGSSDFICYTPQSFTAKLTFNTDYDTLKQRESEGINKSILTYKEFRKAFSLCINRQEYVSQCTATHRPGFGLYNNLYIYDSEKGLVYRDSDIGKEVLCKLYDVNNINNITGYDKKEASELFLEAYEKALADDNISDNDIIEIDFLTYDSDESYKKIINFFQKSIDESITGTVLENRIKINMIQDKNFYTSMEQGQFDMSFANWGGSSLDPYAIMECYTDMSVLLEFGFNSSVEMLTINIDGQDITKSYSEWYIELCKGEYALVDTNMRITIMASMELGILDQYRTIPLYYYNTAALNSKKVILGSESYNAILSYGGIKYLDYAYNDKEWEIYCKENDYNLQY